MDTDGIQTTASAFVIGSIRWSKTWLKNTALAEMLLKKKNTVSG